MLIELLELSTIKKASNQARKHSAKQIDKLANLIKRNGFNSALIVDEANMIIAGHARLAAIQKLGFSKVPCVRLEGLSDAEKRAYRLADNRIALEAEWDLEVLSKELKFVHEAGLELDATAFEQFEFDQVQIDARDASLLRDNPEDAVPQLCPGKPVTELGDMWMLGCHRLVCGDAKASAMLETLMNSERADMAFLDPPYNVPIGGHVSGKGRARHREFVEASGELSRPEFVQFLKEAFLLVERYCRNGAIVYTCIDWRHVNETLEAGHAVFTNLKNLCVWVKSNAGMGTFYRSQHELIPVWKVGDAPHVNTFGLGAHGRSRSNTWQYAGVNTFKAERKAELALHPTVKPVALVADAVRDVSHRGDIVLDTFGGSGTTLIACQRTGRRARLLELDPLYCDVIVRRWQKLTGKDATLAGSDRSFEQVERDRNGATDELEVAA